MRKLVYSFAIYAAIASPSLANAEGLEISVPIGTCHPANLIRDLINKVFLNGQTAEHQALSSLPRDFSDIAAQNRALADALDFAFVPPGDSRALTVAASDVQSINKAVDKLKQDIKSVSSDWVNTNSTVWGQADQAAFAKANFVNGELMVYLSGGPEKITQQQAAKLSSDLRNQADRMEKMSTAIRVALQGSPPVGASQPIPREDCPSEQ